MMRAYALREANFGHYHTGDLAVLASDLDEAIDAFAQHLIDRPYGGEDELRMLVGELVGADYGQTIGLDTWWYDDRDWDHPVDGIAPYKVPTEEIKRLLREKLGSLAWEIHDPMSDRPVVLAYDNGSC